MEDRRNAGENGCNFGDGTDQRVQFFTFMMMITMSLTGDHWIEKCYRVLSLRCKGSYPEFVTRCWYIGEYITAEVRKLRCVVRPLNLYVCFDKVSEKRVAF